MESGSRVYAPGTKVTHSFAVTENRVTMEDRTGHGEDERDRAGSPLVSRPKSPGTHRKLQPAGQSPRQVNNPSGATKELDDLMASLNDFKVVNDSNTYSSETKTSSRFTDTTSHNYGSGSPARDLGDSSRTKGGSRASPLSDINYREQETQRTGGGSRASDVSDNNTCAACNRQVSGQECRKPFESGSFFDLDGRPYCEQHYHSARGSVCGTCQEPISGRCITAMGKKFHPDHFVCSYCVRPLNKGTFKEHANKPWCHNCFERLYGSKKDGSQGDDGADM